MSGGVLILFISGGVGAMALGLWMVLRRGRARPKLALSPSHTTKLVTDPSLTYQDGGHANLAPTGARMQSSFDDYVETKDASSVDSPARKPDANGGCERLVQPPVAGPSVIAQPAEVDSKHTPRPTASYEDNDARATKTVATADGDIGAAEILVNMERESEAPVLGVPNLVPLPENLQERSPDLATVVAGCIQAMPVPNEFVGVDTGPREMPSSYEPILPPAPDEMLDSRDHRDLIDAIGGAGGVALVGGEHPGDTFAMTDEFCSTSVQDSYENEGTHAEETLPPFSTAATERLSEPAAVAGDLTAETTGIDLVTLSCVESEGFSEPKEDAPDEQAPAVRSRPSKPAQHRDRRGQRRRARPKITVTSGASSPPSPVSHTPAEVRLRLMIHPVRRTVGISAVLARPVGYPDKITLFGVEMDVEAYGEDRYDDVDLEWTPSLLSEEIRLDSAAGYQWLRSSRRIHIFREQVDEQGLMSAGSAPLNSSNAVVCLQDDVEAVRSVAAACGSPELVSHDGWTGVPKGWAVLSGYRPAHSSLMSLEPYLTTLDPRATTEIKLSDGLQLGSSSFAQGFPPKIEVRSSSLGARITIDGVLAEINNDGCWWADGWDKPGDHLIDVVPGPSLTYRIVSDPWIEGGWESWDAHPGRFQGPNDGPWARTQVCGASISGPSGEHVVAAKPASNLIALGLRRGASMVLTRPDAPVAVGLLCEAPAFLISSSGPRRAQGRVDWLVPREGRQLPRLIDPSWVAVVRRAVSRRLPLSTDSPEAQDAWLRARTRARRHRKPEA